MKKFGKGMSEAKIEFLPLFIVSIFTVMFIMFFQKSELLVQTDVLDENSLSLMKYHAGNNKSLFLFVLRERIWVVLFMFLMSTTYLAGVTVWGIIIWYGTGIGALLAISIMRYGVAGIFLLLAAGMPHYLLYVPAMIITLQLCKERRIPNKKFWIQFIVLEAVVIIGCFLESYVNLMLVEKIINNFIGL